MVSATLQKSFQQIDTPVLATDAANLVSTGKLDMFAERYGDRFVRGAYLGGQFFGIFRIETKDETSRQNIDTALGVLTGYSPLPMLKSKSTKPVNNTMDR